MGVVKSRGVARKLGSLGLGRVVQIKPRNINRKFAIHEGLLCATSAHFKKRLQERRISSIADVTLCKAECGKNIHQHCLYDWRKSKAGGLTCPMCRKDRQASVDTLFEFNHSKVDLDPQAFQFYVDWLYTGEFKIDPAILTGSDAFNVHLLKAWTVSDAVTDFRFRNAIIARLTQAMETKGDKGFGLDSVKYAYKVDKSRLMETFVTLSFYPKLELEWLIEAAATYLQAFIREIYGERIHALRHFKRRRSQRHLETFTAGEYELDFQEQAGPNNECLPPTSSISTTTLRKLTGTGYPFQMVMMTKSTRAVSHYTNHIRTSHKLFPSTNIIPI
ncbi:hypothetical protein E8E11_008446 [Didymella keratinophila]|nr:hypothetical protein E8E11_008446 [Didymella keratinophila]